MERGEGAGQEKCRRGGARPWHGWVAGGQPHKWGVGGVRGITTRGGGAHVANHVVIGIGHVDGSAVDGDGEAIRLVEECTHGAVGKASIPGLPSQAGERRHVARREGDRMDAVVAAIPHVDGAPVGQRGDAVRVAEARGGAVYARNTRREHVGKSELESTRATDLPKMNGYAEIKRNSRPPQGGEREEQEARSGRQ